MPRTLSPERKELKAHAITLRKMGWTEQAIADEIGTPRRTVADWLISVFGDNNTLGNTAKAWSIGDKPRKDKPAIIPELRSFLGSIEEFETDIKFPLIIADPPWNISVANSMAFNFTDKAGRKHTPMTRDFGAWDFQGDRGEYLQQITIWLEKLYHLAAEDSWLWLWCSYKYLSYIAGIAQGVGWEERGWFLWLKTNVPPLTATINSTLMPATEPCLILRKGKGQLRLNNKGLVNYREHPLVAGGERLRDTSNLAAKPLSILSDFIEWSTATGEWVLDAFAGTGSTTRASLQKRRNVFAVEIDKRQLIVLELACEETYGIAATRT